MNHLKYHGQMCHSLNNSNENNINIYLITILPLKDITFSKKYQITRLQHHDFGW